MDDCDRAAADFFTSGPKGRSKKHLAAAMRHVAANAMFKANAIMLMNGVHHAHLGIIEVSAAAHDLRRRSR